MRAAVVRLVPIDMLKYAVLNVTNSLDFLATVNGSFVFKALT